MTSSGNDIFLRNPRNIDENLFVDMSSPSSSRYESVIDLGTPQEVGVGKCVRAGHGFLLSMGHESVGVEGVGEGSLLLRGAWVWKARVGGKLGLWKAWVWKGMVWRKRECGKLGRLSDV